MSRLQRLKAAVRFLLTGDMRARRRSAIPPVTRAEVAELKQFFPRDKFFVLGHARSGTTLLMRLIRLHPEIECNYQAHFFTRRPLLKSLVDTAEAEEWLSRKSNRWNRGRDMSAIVLRAAAEYIMERGAGDGVRAIGDKSPSSNIHGQAVVELHALFPDAKLIYIVRDGRDVAVSERFRNFVEESRFLSPEDRRLMKDLRARPSAFGPTGRSIFSGPMLRRTARGWARDVHEIDTEAARLLKSGYMALRYEDLLQNPLREMQLIWKFLGSARTPRSVELSIKNEMKSNPDEAWQRRRDQGLATFLEKGRSGNWRNLFTPRDRRIFKAESGNVLVEWGYEASNAW